LGEARGREVQGVAPLPNQSNYLGSGKRGSGDRTDEEGKREILRRCLREARYGVNPETGPKGSVDEQLFEIIKALEKQHRWAVPVKGVYERATSLGIPNETTKEFLIRESHAGNLYFPIGGTLDRPPWDEEYGGSVSSVVRAEGHHRGSQPEETFRTLEEKLKGIETPEEFDEVQNWWMREMMRLEPIMRKIEDISLEKYGVPPTTTKLFLKVKGESLTLYNRGNITLEATGVPVLFLLKKDEEALSIFRGIVDFIDQKYPGEDLEIRVGRQPISVAGRKGFRVGIPPKEAPISMMFPYSMEVLREFEELERRGHPSRVLWATMDFFHEMGHTKGITDEKECDRFALKLTKEYLKVDA